MLNRIAITEPSVTKKIEELGSGDSAVRRETYAVRGVPGLDAVLKVLEYGYPL